MKTSVSHSRAATPESRTFPGAKDPADTAENRKLSLPLFPSQFSITKHGKSPRLPGRTTSMHTYGKKLTHSCRTTCQLPGIILNQQHPTQPHGDTRMRSNLRASKNKSHWCQDSPAPAHIKSSLHLFTCGNHTPLICHSCSLIPALLLMVVTRRLALQFSYTNV